MTGVCQLIQVRVYNRVVGGHENGWVSVFSILAKIQKFITLLCPNFAQSVLPSPWRSLRPLPNSPQPLIRPFSSRESEREADGRRARVDAFLWEFSGGTKWENGRPGFRFGCKVGNISSAHVQACVHTRPFKEKSWKEAIGVVRCVART